MKLLLFAMALPAGVAMADSNVSPWLSRVLEFRPAPSQFNMEVPELTPEMTPEHVLDVVKNQICGAKTPGLISLGAFGGYVTVAFDHPVVNVKGSHDFRIYGNAFITDKETRAGSAEPGSVWVSADVNENGLPDDPFYELKGSEYHESTTLRDYTITYYAPDPEREPVKDPDHKFIYDSTYIRWTDNEGGEGYLPMITFHTQSYWPLWADGQESISFTGTRIAPVSVDSSGKGTKFTSYAPEWGYADCYPNDGTDWGFDISNAVDSEGNPVKLVQIDFIRVQTAVNQFCGWIGEASTEVSGGEDLHPDAVPEESGVFGIDVADSSRTRYYDIAGREISEVSLVKGSLYIKVSGSKREKFIMR